MPVPARPRLFGTARAPIAFASAGRSRWRALPASPQPGRPRLQSGPLCRLAPALPCLSPAFGAAGHRAGAAAMPSVVACQVDMAADAALNWPLMVDLPTYLARLAGPAVISRKVPSPDPQHPIAAIRVLSVPSPSAVSPVLLQGGRVVGGEAHAVLTYSDRHSGLDGQAGAVCMIQRVSGARVREVLSLSTLDIVPPDQFLIRALKKSQARTIRVPEFTLQLLAHLAMPPHPLFHLSYSQVYRLYIKAGILDYGRDGQRNTVTHLLRRNHIKSVHRTSRDLTTTSQAVGHKSTRSTQTYLDKGTRNG